MSTIYINRKIVKTLYRKFVKTFINTRIFRALFDDLTIKNFFISDFINFYNYFINNVDVIN